VFADAAEVVVRRHIVHPAAGRGEPLQHHERVVATPAQALRAGEQRHGVLIPARGRLKNAPREIVRALEVLCGDRGEGHLPTLRGRRAFSGLLLAGAETHEEHEEHEGREGHEGQFLRLLRGAELAEELFGGGMA
jgi:hypothetical protein